MTAKPAPPHPAHVSADALFAGAEADPELSPAQARELEEPLRAALLKAQYARLQRPERALLVVIAGLDGAGKGATINLLNEWMDPRHIATLAFGEPGPADVPYPPMRRYWHALPARGRTGIVFGSWYRPLLQEWARKNPDQDACDEHVEAIRRFEATLAANGVDILKLWFHLSRDAQRKRTRELLSDPRTAWQVAEEDRKVYKRFAQLRQAGARTIAHTDAPHAPWLVVPSADAPLRMVSTARAVLNALRRAPAPVRRPAPPRRRIPDRIGALDYEARVGRDEYEDELAALQAGLAAAVRRKRFGKRSLVLAFEGQDAAGKGGAIRRVTHALDARQYDIMPVSAPLPHELAQPYLWRFWRRVPARGRIAIFDRSWYGRVLVERVEGLVAPADWRRAYEEINEFERELDANGALVLKFWLAVGKAEQLRRFREREQSPFKSFKITPDDWRNRKRWDDYLKAANEMLARTDTAHAPWHVLAADDKRLARLQVLRAIVNALEQA